MFSERSAGGRACGFWRRLGATRATNGSETLPKLAAGTAALRMTKHIHRFHGLSPFVATVKTVQGCPSRLFTQLKQGVNQKFVERRPGFFDIFWQRFFALAALGLCLLASGADKTSSNRGPSRKQWPRYVLQAEQTWQLNSPRGERFDASGLLLTQQGDLLTVNDRGATLYRIQFSAKSGAADLSPLPDCFTPAQLAALPGRQPDRYDCEGVAQDEQGRLYVCVEGNRWVLRCDPKIKTVERLNIDWSPVKKYFHPTDLNASFEGIAIGGGRLYLANERRRGRIIVVDMATLQVVDNFGVKPSGSQARDLDYCDLSWFDGRLFVLLRESRCVLAVDPDSQRVVAEYNFREMEEQPEVRYYTRYPTGTMEGLAVERDFIWLVTDNNGLGRVRHPRDIRPTLFKCRRQDGKGQ